jgi:chromodomain-helicase-DNA-binding protein 1
MQVDGQPDAQGATTGSNDGVKQGEVVGAGAVPEASPVPVAPRQPGVNTGPPGQRPELHRNVRRFLVKWEGLPYSECTWEAEDDVRAAPGGPQQVGQSQDW